MNTTTIPTPKDIGFEKILWAHTHYCGEALGKIVTHRIVIWVEDDGYCMSNERYSEKLEYSSCTRFTNLDALIKNLKDWATFNDYVGDCTVPQELLDLVNEYDLLLGK